VAGTLNFVFLNTKKKGLNFCCQDSRQGGNTSYMYHDSLQQIIQALCDYIHETLAICWGMFLKTAVHEVEAVLRKWGSGNQRHET
jgi:hypothetical protein